MKLGHLATLILLAAACDLGADDLEVTSLEAGSSYPPKDQAVPIACGLAISPTYWSWQLAKGDPATASWGYEQWLTKPTGALTKATYTTKTDGHVRVWFKRNGSAGSIMSDADYGALATSPM